MGVVWGWKYIKQPDQKSRLVGYAAIGLTALSLLLAIRATMGIIHSVSTQVNQIQNLQGF